MPNSSRTKSGLVTELQRITSWSPLVMPVAMRPRDYVAIGDTPQMTRIELLLGEGTQAKWLVGNTRCLGRSPENRL